MQRPSLAVLPRGITSMPPMPALVVPSWRWAFAALGIALIAQATVLHGMQFRGGSVSLVFLVVLWFAAAGGPARGAFFGLIAGACSDALAGGTGAAWTVSTPVAAALAARVVGLSGWDHPLFLGLIAAFAALARTVAFWLVLRAEGGPMNIGAPEAHAALWSAALDGVVAAVALLAFHQLRPPHVDRR
jgi:cell shape-determining protein MreD